uniref:Macaca fascicularis brain cDNA clone: QflA-20021, similar to human O-acyltransferase (membrane bound) domain containing 1(OACT1), mRNA, RefSeq: XM_371801.2 n=1 Tax=Macaca fascicularis TaxID=9541 RepID=I7GLY9_MACFA|nr:unnamed protein product [Macaca fascicularis]
MASLEQFRFSYISHYTISVHTHIVFRVTLQDSESTNIN